MDMSIIVPVFNEELNILPLYQSLQATLSTLNRSYEIIFINDGSRDNSREVLNSLANISKHVKIIHFRRNFGQTAAMMAGFDYSEGAIIIPLDGDLQNDPKDIPRLLAKIDEGYDLCSGWRKERKDSRFKRNFVSRVANILISRVSGVVLNDYGCTLKAYRRSIVKDIKLYGEMHRFIPIYATWLGAKVTELPVNHHPRVAGQSKYGIERTFKVLLDLLLIKFMAKFSQKPIYVFGGVGFLNFALAFLACVGCFYLKFFKGISFSRTPLPLLTVMMIILGTMCILLGFLAELMMRTYFESQCKPTYLYDELVNFPPALAISLEMSS